MGSGYGDGTGHSRLSRLCLLTSTIIFGMATGLSAPSLLCLSWGLVMKLVAAGCISLVRG